MATQPVSQKCSMIVTNLRRVLLSISLKVMEVASNKMMAAMVEKQPSMIGQTVGGMTIAKADMFAYEDPVDGPLRDMDLDLTMVIDEEIKKLMTPEQLEELENAAFQETIRQSRGERESQGVRDQWESKDGIGRKEDLRRKMTKKTRRRNSCC